MDYRTGREVAAALGWEYPAPDTPEARLRHKAAERIAPNWSAMLRQIVRALEAVPAADRARLLAMAEGGFAGVAPAKREVMG